MAFGLGKPSPGQKQLKETDFSKPYNNKQPRRSGTVNYKLIGGSWAAEVGLWGERERRLHINILGSSHSNLIKHKIALHQIYQIMFDA